MFAYLENYFNLKKSFVFYGSYHHEWRNQFIHVVFVPVIFTTFLGFTSKLQITEKVNVSHAITAFYAASFIIMEPLAGTLYAPVLAGMQYIGQTFCAPNVTASLVAQGIAWGAQVLSHKFFEQRKPAFTEDPLQAVHAAVFFVWLDVLYALGYRRSESDVLVDLVEKRIEKLDQEEAAEAAGVPA